MFQPTLQLTVDNARATLEQGVQAIEAGQQEIDFSQIKSVDSTAVATLLAWQRTAKHKGAPLAFRNLPANLKSLIALYDVDALLHH